MTRSLLTLAALCVVVSTSAFAAAPHPTAIDADGDGALVATIDVNGDTKVDHLDIGVRASQYDCDDVHDNVSPRLPEIVDNGIDDDCSGSDATWPTGLAKKATQDLYLANSGTSSPYALVLEYTRCNAATGRCTPDDKAGKFLIVDPDVDRFDDVYVGTGLVLGRDGKREVVSHAEASHFRSGSAGFSGPSKATRTAEALAVATPLVVAETKARTDADDVLGGRIDDEAKARTEADIGLGERIDKVDEAAAKLFEAEAKTRADADTNISNGAATAMRNARAAASHGPLIEAYALGGVMFDFSPVTDNGRVVRNRFGGGGGGGINVGVDADGYRFNAFVDTIIGADGGAGPAHSEAIGVDYIPDDGLWFLPPHTGIFAAYGVRHTQRNALQSQVVGKNPIVGLSVAVPFAQNGATHGLVGGRIGCGPQVDGIAGDRVTSTTSIGCRGEIVLGGGVGALQ